MRALPLFIVLVLPLLAVGLVWGQPQLTVGPTVEVSPLTTLETLEITPPENIDPLPLPKAKGAIFVATLDIKPGVVFRIASGAEHVIYARKRPENLTSFDFGPWLRPTPKPRQVLYFCNAVNDKKIWYAFGPGHEAVLGSHSTYVREVDWGPGKALYFSEASGSAKDGRIYKLAPGSPPTVFYTVKLPLVGGFWAGHFAFDPGGRLHISNGNTSGAQIWACPPAAKPKSVFKTRGSILGFHFTDRKTFLYTDGSPRLRKAQLGGSGSVVFTSPKNHKYCDVVVR